MSLDTYVAFNSGEWLFEPEDLELEAIGVEDSVQTSGQREIHGFAWILVVVSILSSVFLYALDNTIVADILPAMVSDFSSVEELGWMPVGFVVGAVAMIMPFGKIFGMFNVKWLYIGSVGLFLAASALCGAAPNINAEIVGRVFAGAGGVGLYIGVMTLLSLSTTDQERPIYLSLVGLVWSCGTLLGPVVGGALQKASWRWAFYLNLVLGGLMIPIWIFLLPDRRPARSLTLKSRAQSFDLLGAILSICAFVTTVTPINFGGAEFAWGSATVISLLVVAGVSWVAFAVQQYICLWTTPQDRMFPVHFLSKEEPVLLFVCAAACNAAVVIPIYYVPIYFQFTLGDSAIESAVRLLPLILLLCSAILASGYFMAKFGYYIPWYIGGAAMALIGSVLLAQLKLGTTDAYVYGTEALLGLGCGAFSQAGYAVIQTAVDAADFGYAVTFMMIAQIGGIALGLACASAIFLNVATAELHKLLPQLPIDQLQAAISGTSSQVLQRLDSPEREAALAVIVNSIGKALVTAYVGAAVALVAAVFLSRKRVFLKPTAGG